MMIKHNRTNGLIPRVGVLLFEADSESDSDSGQEPGLGGIPTAHP